MKYTIGLVIVAVLAVFGFRALHHVPAAVSGSVSPTPTGSAQADYRLIVIADTVSLNGKAVTGAVSVKAGDQVTTSATGRARLSWPNGTITTLENDSQVTIKDLSDEGAKSRIELIFGDIWSKVTKVLGAGQYYEVQTQDTVAAVRGTVFRTTYRNHIAHIQGIEHVVRVTLRKADGTSDDSTATDVGEQMEVEHDHVAPRVRPSVRRVTTVELQEKTYEHIHRERDLKDDDVREIPRPSVSSSITPKPSLSILPTATPSVSPKTTSTPSPTPTPTPTATPNLSVSLQSTVPSTINVGDTFSLEGQNFTSGRNISQVQSVTVGGQPAEYSIVGQTSIFVTPKLPAGTYDATVVTTTGGTATLKDAITIK